MRQKFSSKWIGSVQPRKQRKFRYNAPLHLRRKFLSTNLSKELRKKHGKRNLPLRKGDEVLIMRGKFAKKKGKALEIDMKKSRITIEGINRKKSDGTKVNVYFNSSNLQIQSLNMEDGKRIKGESKKENTEVKIENKEEKKDNEISEKKQDK